MRSKFTNSVLSLILIVLALFLTGCAAEAAGASSGTPTRGEEAGTSAVLEERDARAAEGVSPAEEAATTSSKAAESVPSTERPGPLSSVEGFRTTSESDVESMDPETEQAKLNELIERFKDKESITLSELTQTELSLLYKYTLYPGVKEICEKIDYGYEIPI